MSFRAFTIDEKVVAIERAIRMIRARYRGAEPEFYYAAKSVLDDTKARANCARNNTLGKFERALESLRQSKQPVAHLGGYDEGQLINLGNMVMNHWPTISQALEKFGEETDE